MTGTPDQRVVLRDAYRVVFELFRKRVSDADTARELTNETFLRLRAWQGGEPGRMPDDLMSFLRRHAEWVRCDHFRKQSRIRDAEQSVGGSEDVAASEDHKVLASADVAHVIDLRRAVVKLSERKRLALKLRYVDDLPTEVIAEVLGVTPRSVNQMIRAAIFELSGSRHLAGYAPEGGHQ